MNGFATKFEPTFHICATVCKIRTRAYRLCLCEETGGSRKKKKRIRCNQTAPAPLTNGSEPSDDHFTDSMQRSKEIHDFFTPESESICDKNYGEHNI